MQKASAMNLGRAIFGIRHLGSWIDPDQTKAQLSVVFSVPRL